MKKIILYFLCLLILSCTKQENPQPESPKIDLSNIGDSAYFHLKWQGKEIFMRENPRQKILVDNEMNSKRSDSTYTYRSMFGKGDVASSDISTKLFQTEFNVYMPEQKLSNFKKYLEVGKKSASKTKFEPHYFISFLDVSQNLYLGGVLQDDDQHYFEILESRSLLEKGSPTEVLIKFRFRYKMYERNVEKGYLEGEAQTRMRYTYMK